MSEQIGLSCNFVPIVNLFIGQLMVAKKKHIGHSQSNYLNIADLNAEMKKVSQSKF